MPSRRQRQLDYWKCFNITCLKPWEDLKPMLSTLVETNQDGRHIMTSGNLTKMKKKLPL